MLKAARVKKSLLMMVFCFGEFETKLYFKKFAQIPLQLRSDVEPVVGGEERVVGRSRPHWQRR